MLRRCWYILYVRGLFASIYGNLEVVLRNAGKHVVCVKFIGKEERENVSNFKNGYRREKLDIFGIHGFEKVFRDVPDQ
jgi:hypothetical protein